MILRDLPMFFPFTHDAMHFLRGPPAREPNLIECTILSGTVAVGKRLLAGDTDVGYLSVEDVRSFVREGPDEVLRRRLPGIVYNNPEARPKPAVKVEKTEAEALASIAARIGEIEAERAKRLAPYRSAVDRVNDQEAVRSLNDMVNCPERGDSCGWLIGENRCLSEDCPRGDYKPDPGIFPGIGIVAIL